MASEIVFYTNPMSRGGIVHWMLEELGEPYDTEVLEFGTTMKAPAYLAVNPMGKVPAIKHGDVVVTEAAAICAYLADAFPQAKLAPPAAERGRYYRWMFFGAGPVEAAVSNKACGFHPTKEQEGQVGYGSLQRVVDTLAEAVAGRQYIAGDPLHRGRRLCRLPDRLGHALRLSRKAPGIRGLLGRPEGPPRPAQGRGSRQQSDGQDGSARRPTGLKKEPSVHERDFAHRHISARGSRQDRQVAPEAVGVASWKHAVELGMAPPPDGNSTCEESPAGRRQLHPAAAPVSRVDRHLDQISPRQGLERGGKRGAVHGEEGGHGAHGRRLGTV